MGVLLGWFTETPDGLAAERPVLALAAEAAALVPDSYERRETRGTDWGLHYLHPSIDGVYHWAPFARDDELIALSLGIPVGADTAGGPLALARRALDGQDVHAEVVPPFGLLAIEGKQRVLAQQDWLGMSRLFIGSANGITAFSNRPTLLAKSLGIPLVPDEDGWSSYAVCGHFGGDTSPIRGVRLLAPGERMTGQRRPGGGWGFASERRRHVDDLVLQGRSLTREEAVDLAAAGISGAMSSAVSLAATPLELGLSGGKDSRLIGAAFVAVGTLPQFNTNIDTIAEGETAAQLLQILRTTRGLDPIHHTYNAGEAAAVLTVGLHERVERLQRLNDFQSPSTYTVRPPAGERLPAVARSMSFTGSGGELGTGYWYPKLTPVDDHPGTDAHEQGSVDPDTDRDLGRATALKNVLPGAETADEAALNSQRARINEILDRGESLGLRGSELCDYVYLVERVRRWYTSAYVTGMVTPFLAPGFVVASFAVPPEAKRQRALHNALLQRYVPEWVDVPYVSVSTGRSTATKIWQGDGLRALSDMLDTHQGRLPGLLQRDQVRAALLAGAARKGTGLQQKTLQQFAWLAVASETLEPETVTTGPATTYAEVKRAMAPPPPPKTAPVPPGLSKVAARLSFAKRLPVAGRAWKAARTRAVKARAGRTR